ncbi:hypothetical protein MLD38_004678 [Melastoma candidum]|uniref:Uncharacterized protein n=1 Tax=Melastoma candidum TaxID=119954 RepID=A0ACB9S5N9_9MYRT|nr:hypothetical protein MLD38_004678 [Melastoma candidum]
MEIMKFCSPCLKLVLGMVSVVHRALEISFALFILFYVSSRIPVAFQHLLNYLLRFLDFVASPAFVFCLCNAIIAAVFAKASRSAAGNDEVGESYSRMIEIHDDLQDHWTLSLLLSDAYDMEELSDKVVVPRDEKINGQFVNFCEDKEEPESNRGSPAPDFDKDCYGIEDEGMMSHEKFPMTNDELKSRVEDFIARELRFRRAESLAIVLPSY